MKEKSELGADLMQEFRPLLSGKSGEEIVVFFERTMEFVRSYASIHQLAGPIYLVLDNSIIQAYKHRHTGRGIDVLAHLAFCRFAKYWNDRPTCLAVTPVAVYEHLGKRALRDATEADEVIRQLIYLLKDTRIKTVSIGFSGAASLISQTKAIQTDDAYLTKYVREIDKSNWKTDLQAAVGVKLPIAIATAALKSCPRLRYFDPWYVQFVLSSRIEKYIVEQSRHNPAAMPIGSGPMSEAMAELNDFSKRSGLLRGLGDIDILQHCDINSQYQQRLPFIKLGQTLDKNLAKVLHFRHGWYESVHILGGQPDQKEQIEKMVSMMFNNPFAEHEKRGEAVLQAMKEFFDALIALCGACVPVPSTDVDEPAK